MGKQKSAVGAPHSVEQILQFAAQLPLDEIEELSFALSALAEAVDGEQPDNQTGLPKCGARGGSRIEWKVINGYGPYPYLRFRRDGKHRSYYLKELATNKKTNGGTLLN